MLKRFAIAFGLASIITLIRLFTTSFDFMIHYADALTIAGALVFLIGMLQFAAHFGAFDTFGYAFASLKSKREYKDLVEYQQIKAEKRRKEKFSFIPFILVGAGFLAVGLTLYSMF